MTVIKDKLTTIKSTRLYCSQSFSQSLQQLLQEGKPISEKILADTWLKNMRKNKKLFPEGWYFPPPHGISILFAKESDVSRVSPPSLRPQEYWPRDDVFLEIRNGLLLVYFSPVDRKTGIIGDFSQTIYFGQSPKIKEHIKKCYHVNLEIFSYIKVGMTLSHIFKYTHELLKSYRLNSDIASPTDPTSTNIGHTIPVSYEDWIEKERSLLKGKKSNWEDIKNMISKKRVFLNSVEKFKVRKGMAFTIEPRPYILNNKSIPAVLFHMIVLIWPDGRKELLTNFHEIFKLAHMYYMLN